MRESSESEARCAEILRDREVDLFLICVRFRRMPRVLDCVHVRDTELASDCAGCHSVTIKSQSFPKANRSASPFLMRCAARSVRRSVTTGRCFRVRWEARRLVEFDRYIVIHPLSVERARNISDSFWKQVIQEAGRTSNVVLVGTAEDRVLVETMAAGCPTAISLAGQTDLRELMRVIEESEGAIGVDSFCAHVGLAYDKPVAVICVEGISQTQSFPEGTSRLRFFDCNPSAAFRGHCTLEARSRRGSQGESDRSQWKIFRNQAAHWNSDRRISTFDAIVRASRKEELAIFADSRFEAISAWKQIPGVRWFEVPFMDWSGEGRSCGSSFNFPGAAKKADAGLRISR